MAISLADAILLGSMHYVPKGGEFFDDDNGACALGMAIGAVGREQDARNCRGTLLGHSWQNAMLIIESEWPWLKERCDQLCPVCGTDGFDFDTEDGIKIGSYACMVVHLFDDHVMQSTDDGVDANDCPSISLELLVDWVKSVEPEENYGGSTSASKISTALEAVSGSRR